MLVVARRSTYGWLALAFATLVLALSVTPAASAREYLHGKTVWFGDDVIADGDDVRGDLDIFGGTVVCESGAIIRGNVHTFFGTFDQRDGCDVGGRVTNALSGDALDAYIPWTAPLTNDDFVSQNRSLFKHLGWDVVVFFAFLLFPLRVRVALDRIEKHPGWCALGGTLAAIAVIPIAILLLCTIVGIPLIPIEIAAVFGGVWIGQAAIALLIGRRFYELVRPHRTSSPLGAILLGLIVMTAAQSLPGVGWAVSALVMLAGLGATILGLVREQSFAAFAGHSPLRHFN